MADRDDQFPCPNRSDISSFVTGEYHEGDEEALARHVASCPDCMDVINSDDELVLAWLRQSVGQGEAADAERAAVELAKRVEGVTASQPPHPQAIRDYEIIERLGAGGMGTVYKAKHKKLRRVVALKVLGGRLLNDPVAVQRFEREMEAVGKLSHPNIVGASDAGEADGTHYLVMEYVDGVDLGEVIRQGGTLSVADACEVCRQAALALGHAHQAGLIHRDVKPSNLMLTREGAVKLLDLGLARVEQSELEHGEITSTGQVMGTVDYMAPEQARGSEELDARVDVYGLGATLFRLLSGRTPFTLPAHEPAWKKLAAISDGRADSLQEVCPELDASLAHSVNDMLNSNADERTSDMSEVSTKLSPFCDGNDLRAVVRSAADSPETMDAARVETDALDAPDASSREHRRRAVEIKAKDRSSRQSTEATPERPRWLPIAIALGLFGVFAAAAIMLSIKTPEGSIEIELAENVADDVQIQVLQGGKQVQLLDRKTGWSIQLDEGDYQLALNDSSDECRLDRTNVSVSRDGKEIVRVEWKPSIAPPTPVSNSRLPSTGWPQSTQESELFGLLETPAKFNGIPDWQISGQTDNVKARFSPDGKYLLRTWHANQRYVELIHVASGDVLRTHRLAPKQSWYGVAGTAWSPDSRKYCIESVIPGQTSYLEIHATDATIPPTRFDLGNLGIDACAWSPDGERIAVAERGNGRLRVRLWQSNGQPHSTLMDKADALGAAWGLYWSPSSHVILVVLSDSALLVDLETVEETSILPDRSGGIHGAAWAPDGTALAIAGSQRVFLTDHEGKVIRDVVLPGSYASDLVWTADSQAVAVVSGQPYVVPRKGALTQLDGKAKNWVAAWGDADSQRLLCLDSFGQTQRFSLEDGSAGAIVEHPTTCLPFWNRKGVPPADNLIWNQDGTKFAAFSRQGPLGYASHAHVWNDDGTSAATCGPLPEMIEGLAFDPHDDHVAIMTRGKSHRYLWKWSGTADDRGKRFLAKHMSEQHNHAYQWPQLSFSRDGRFVATSRGIVDRTKDTMTWGPECNGETGHALMRWSPTHDLFGVVFNRKQGTAFYDSEGTLVRQLPRVKHRGSAVRILRAASWSPDGKWLAVPSTYPQTVVFFSPSGESRVSAGNADLSGGSLYSNWDWTPDSERFIGFTGDKFVSIRPDDPALQITSFTRDMYTHAMMALDPNGSQIALIKDQATLRMHEIDTRDTIDVGPLTWQARIFADGSNVALDPTGRLISESNNGSKNVRCIVREYNGALSNYSYPDFIRRAQLSKAQRAMMTVLSIGGAIRSSAGGDADAISSANIRGVRAVEKLKGPVVADLTKVADVDLEAIAFLRDLPTGSAIKFTDNSWCTDDVIAQLRDSGRIVRLELGGTRITSKSGETLATLTELRHLDLSDTGIRDTTVEAIGKLSNLESLDLATTLITDQALAALVQLKNVRELCVEECQLSAAAVARFEKLRGNCRIVR